MRKQQEKLLKICVWSSVILFGLRCAFSWETVILGISLYDFFGYAGEAITVSVAFSYFYETFLWRVMPFENTPKLAKRYTGVLKSNYDGIEREASLLIKQTLLSVHVTLISNESKSSSVTASIEDVLGEMRLTYCYLNTPKAEYRKRSEIHYGTASLSVVNPKKLDGQYYTDRNTTGDMVFTAVDEK